MQRNLTPYDYEIYDMLNNTHMPFSGRLSEYILDKHIKKTNVDRLIVSAFIDLEKLNKELTDELVQYKLRFGEIN